MRGVRGVNRPTFACGDKLTLELNLANNTLMFLFYKRMRKGCCFSGGLSLHITVHAGLHATTCDRLLPCLSSVVMPLQHLNYLRAATNGMNVISRMLSSLITG